MSQADVPAAQYVRMSTGHQQYSIDNQACAIGLYAEAHGFRIVDSEGDDSTTSAQMKWSQEQLDSLPPEIEFVFVMLHRPPHTSAHDAGHRERPSEQKILEWLADQHKALSTGQFIVIAGHVHNYERYRRDNIYLIVSGGGGGGAHSHALTRGAADLYRPRNPIEDEYHYCLIGVDRGKLKFEMYRLIDAASGTFEVRDSLELPPK